MADEWSNRCWRIKVEKRCGACSWCKRWIVSGTTRGRLARENRNRGRATVKLDVTLTLAILGGDVERFQKALPSKGGRYDVRSPFPLSRVLVKGSGRHCGKRYLSVYDICMCFGSKEMQQTMLQTL